MIWFRIFDEKRTLIIGALLVLLCIAYCVSFNSESADFPDRYYGNPVLSAQYPQINISIEKVVDDGQYMYLLLHHANGIVQVCDLNGNYQHTLFFYCHMNGGFSLAAENDAVYVQDMRNNVYVLKNGEFDSFLKEEDADKQLTGIDFDADSSSLNYEIRSGAVWRVSNDNEVCVLEQPKQTSHYANQFVLIFAIAFGVGWLFLRKNQRCSTP